MMASTWRWYVHNSRGDCQYEFEDIAGVLEKVEELLEDAQSHREDDVITLQFVTEPEEL